MRQQRRRVGADGALRRPHAAGPHPDVALEHLQPDADLLDGVVAAVHRPAGQGQLGAGDARAGGIDEQGQDGVVRRRGHRLDLAGVDRIAVERDHLAQQVHLPGVEQRLVRLAEAAAARGEGEQLGVGLDVPGVDPDQHPPRLQVAHLVEAERRGDLVGVAVAQAVEHAHEGLEQPHLVGKAGAAGEADQEAAVGGGEVGGGAQAEVAVGVPGVAGGVGGELLEQRGDVVDGDAQVGMAGGQPGHAPVVLAGAQPRPGEQEAARGVVAVVGLVHVPDDGDVQRRHGGDPSSGGRAGQHGGPVAEARGPGCRVLFTAS